MNHGIKAPSEVIELRGLQSESGSPVRVRCDRPDPFEVLAVLGVLHAAEVKKNGTAEVVSDEDPEALARYRARGQQLIEIGTTLLLEDGNEVRPAFWFNEEKPGAIPGRYLTLDDMSTLLGTVTRLAGLAGGAADKLSFRDDGGGRADGGGVDGDLSDATAVGGGSTG